MYVCLQSILLFFLPQIIGIKRILLRQFASLVSLRKEKSIIVMGFITFQSYSILSIFLIICHFNFYKKYYYILIKILPMIENVILIVICSFLHCPKKNQKTLALDCSPTHYFLNSEIQRTRFAQTALDFCRIFEKRVPCCHSQWA
jgi:hypothetical protein